MWKDLVRLARPGHWIKNVFVLAPVPFAVRAGAHFAPGPFLLGFLGFCLVNSAVYALNDLCDAEADRRHPQERLRPIASGKVPAGPALLEAGVLLALGMALCFAARKEGVVPLVLAYAGVNLVYSLGAKHWPLVDVFLLGSGYVIRILLGCALVEAAPSAWLLLCGSALALFLTFTKRRAELAAGLDPDHRPSIAGYTVAFLDQAMVISAAVALSSYALYCIESGMLVEGREPASIPFVAFGILNYFRLVQVGKLGVSPVEAAYTSPSCQLCAAGWLVAVAWSLGIW